jgi:uncharacterized membrane-anchored protein
MIVRASAQIRSLGNKIDSILMRSQPQNDTTLDPHELRDIQDQLNAIQSGVKPGGLSYRVARSRYYADAFQKRVTEMRIHRLDGFEPYDIFIARNLYQVFNFISTVGVRYQALAERTLRLATSHNVERMTNMTSEINAVQQKVLKIQRLGEAIGIGAFAYYVGHIISLFIKAVVKAQCLIGHEIEKCNERIERIDEYVEIAGIVIALIIAVTFLSKLWDWWSAKADKRDAMEGKAASAFERE